MKTTYHVVDPSMQINRSSPISAHLLVSLIETITRSFFCGRFYLDKEVAGGDKMVAYKSLGFVPCYKDEEANNLFSAIYGTLRFCEDNKITSVMFSFNFTQEWNAEAMVKQTLYAISSFEKDNTKGRGDSSQRVRFLSKDIYFLSHNKLFREMLKEELLSLKTIEA